MKNISRRAQIVILVGVAFLAAAWAIPIMPTSDTFGYIGPDGSFVAENAQRHPVAYLWIATMVIAAASSFAAGILLARRSKTRRVRTLLTVAAVFGLPNIVTPIAAIIARKMMRRLSPHD